MRGKIGTVVPIFFMPKYYRAMPSHRNINSCQKMNADKKEYKINKNA